jgi:hypothetical protein
LWLTIHSSLVFISTLMTTTSIALAFLIMCFKQTFGTATLPENNPFYTIRTARCSNASGHSCGFDYFRDRGRLFQYHCNAHIPLHILASGFLKFSWETWATNCSRKIHRQLHWPSFLLDSIRQDSIYHCRFSSEPSSLWRAGEHWIYFIHHVSVYIHAKNVFACVGRDVEHSVNSFFHEKMGIVKIEQDSGLRNHITRALE